MKYFSYFSYKRDFDISCKLSPLETVCIKCQSLFSGEKQKKNKKIKLSSAEIAQSVVKVNYLLKCLETSGPVANSVDPDQMPQYVASDLGLHYLPEPVCRNT